MKRSLVVMVIHACLTLFSIHLSCLLACFMGKKKRRENRRYNACMQVWHYCFFHFLFIITIFFFFLPILSLSPFDF